MSYVDHHMSHRILFLTRVEVHSLLMARISPLTGLKCVLYKSCGRSCLNCYIVGHDWPAQALPDVKSRESRDQIKNGWWLVGIPT